MLSGPVVIPDDEIDARVATLQRMMPGARVVGGPLLGAHRDYAPADLWYLARWSCIDEETSYVFVPGAGETTLITDAEWDLERSRVEARAGSIAFDAEPARSLGRLVRDHCRAGDRIGVSGLSTMPAPVYLELASTLPEVRLEDATWLTAGQRVVKSELELDLMREAARISDLGLAAGVAAMVEGAAEFEVAATAECAIRSEGAELSFTTVMGSGPRTALTTFLPTERRLARGDIAVLDCGARVAGYHGDMCRTTVVGPPTAEQRRMLDAARGGRRGGDPGRPPGGEGRRHARGGEGRGGRGGVRRVLVGLLHAARRGGRPARDAPGAGGRGHAAASRHGPVHRAGHRRGGRRGRGARADGRHHRRRLRGDERAPLGAVGGLSELRVPAVRSGRWAGTGRPTPAAPAA